MQRDGCDPAYYRSKNNHYKNMYPLICMLLGCSLVLDFLLYDMT
jgi:hypothetical protein